MDPVMQALTTVRQNPELLANLKAAGDPDTKRQLLSDAGIELSLSAEDKERLEVIAAGGSAPVSDEYLDSVTGGGQQLPTAVITADTPLASDVNITAEQQIGTTAGGKAVYMIDATISSNSNSNSSDDDDDDDDDDDGGDADDASDASDASDAADASDGADAADAAAAFLL